MGAWGLCAALGESELVGRGSTIPDSPSSLVLLELDPVPVPVLMLVPSTRPSVSSALVSSLRRLAFDRRLYPCVMTGGACSLFLFCESQGDDEKKGVVEEVRVWC